MNHRYFINRLHLLLSLMAFIQLMFFFSCQKQEGNVLDRNNQNHLNKLFQNNPEFKDLLTCLPNHWYVYKEIQEEKLEHLAGIGKGEFELCIRPTFTDRKIYKLHCYANQNEIKEQAQKTVAMAPMISSIKSTPYYFGETTNYLLYDTGIRYTQKDQEIIIFEEIYECLKLAVSYDSTITNEVNFNTISD
jgi:hypothetical protein